MILLLEDNSCKVQRGKKCEFSMNSCKNLVLANQKIFRTIWEADWQGFSGLCTSVASPQTCVLCHIPVKSSILDLPVKNWSSGRNSCWGPALGSCKPHSFQMLAVVKKWISRKELCCGVTFIFKRWNLLVTTNYILPYPSKFFHPEQKSWDWCLWCPCSVLGKVLDGLARELFYYTDYGQLILHNNSWVWCIAIYHPRQTKLKFEYGYIKAIY